MDIKELYKQRYTEIKTAQKAAHDELSNLDKERDKIILEFVTRAKEEAIVKFNEMFGKAENDAAYALARANDELTLLRCPDERYHCKPEGNYYRCQTCTFVWDDTSPAHF